MPHPTPSFKIAVDDYGLHPNIDKAIHDLATQGIIHKISVMANTAYDPHPLPDHIETGLHVDLTTPHCLGNKPLANTPFQLLTARNLSQSDIEDRAQAQLEYVIARGFKITHIDTHQHVHIIPIIRKALYNIAQKHAIPNIRCLTLQAHHHPFYLRALIQCGFLKQNLKLQALYTGGLAMRSALENHTSTPNLILMPLAQNGHYEKLLHKIKNRFQHQNAELVTHPGLPANLPAEPYIAGREIEYRALLNLNQP